MTHMASNTHDHKFDNDAPNDYDNYDDNYNDNYNNPPDDDEDDEEEQLLAWLHAWAANQSVHHRNTTNDRDNNLWHRFLQLFPSISVSKPTPKTLKPTQPTDCHINNNSPRMHQSPTKQPDAPSKVIMPPPSTRLIVTGALFLSANHIKPTLFLNNASHHMHLMLHKYAATTIQQVWCKHAIRMKSRLSTPQPRNTMCIMQQTATLPMPGGLPMRHPCITRDFCTSSV